MALFFLQVDLENTLNNDLNDSPPYLLYSPLPLSLLLAVSLPLTFSAPSYSQQPDTWGNAPVQTLSNKHSCAETTSISDSALGIGSRPMWTRTQL